MPYRVAIIIRTKNRPLFLARAFESLRRQSFQDFRVYVINDGGDPDEVFRVISLYGPSEADRVVQMDLPTSAGRAQAMSIGLGLVKEEYVHIHDDDDTLEPEFYARTVAYLDDDQAGTFVGVTTSSYDIVEHMEEGQIVFDKRFDTLGRKEGSIVDYGLFLAHVSLLSTITTVFRRSAIPASDGVNTTLPYVEDQDFFQRLMLAGEVGIIPDFLANYHQRPLRTGGPDDKSETEFSYDAIIAYTNTVLRDAIQGKGRMRELQAAFLQQARQEYRLAASFSQQAEQAREECSRLRQEMSELRGEFNRLSRFIVQLADRLEGR
ncbi:glycosyltransferase family 2 protein [Bombella favorum]|uniref:Glycosyltransferase 2-like domain-containing protein n=1 Tax=Bombella favorum TaxID=2039164 RepID=A0ABR5ZLY2_9PROT|nr:glycosyltransferase family 2 protein [Bombella favorum]MBA5725328.1 hypothetical protein [Bombella favorum]